MSEKSHANHVHSRVGSAFDTKESGVSKSPPAFSLTAAPAENPTSTRGMGSGSDLVTRGEAVQTKTEGTGGGKEDKAAAKAPKKRGKLKSGPTYSPTGAIAATVAGGRKSAAFSLAAEFEHDPAKGIYAECCEVRQYLKWTGDCYPDHAGFHPKSSYKKNVWYEDRDAANKRYGHRAGSYSDPQSFDEYVDSSGTRDMAKGAIYRGSDGPGGPSTVLKSGKWYFRMDVIDVCNGNKVLGSDKVHINW